MRAFASIQPKKGTREHTSALVSLSPLVGADYDPAPGKGCWKLVRDGLEILGAEEVPEHFAACIGLAVRIEPCVNRAMRLGDVLVLEHRDQSAREHVALALGDGRAMHTAHVTPEKRVAVIERIGSLLKHFTLREIARPKQFVAELHEAAR